MLKVLRLRGLISLFVWVCTVCVAEAQTYTIYPVPHSMKAAEGTLSWTTNVNVVTHSGVDEITQKRLQTLLEEKGFQVNIVEPSMSEGLSGVSIFLGVVGADDAIEAVATEKFGLKISKILVSNKYDRHALAVSQHGVVILGEHTNAVFMGIASLEQMLEQMSEGALPGVTIYDYADQECRGLVEGYYGYPYTVSVKKDLMRYMMRYKMNTYIYGAKSDPYHSQYWKDAYPTTISFEQEKNGWLTQAMVQEIADVSTQTKVNFIWAIHPGNEFLGSATAIDDIMSKFEKMHHLGVRHFGVFVDDVGIPSSDADMQKNAQRVTELQQKIEKKWNGKNAVPADTVRPLHFVPQIYCNSFASSVDQRQRFMKALQVIPSYVTVYSTGQGVWSVPNNDHTETIMNEFKRPMGWWWNYPCNDNADGQIYTMDMYSNFYDMPAVDGNARLPKNLLNCQGLIANPMQQGEIAKATLFHIADYAWNNANFNNQKSWEASIKSLIADEKICKAYKDITPYLRWNEPQSLQELIEDYKASLEAQTPNAQSLTELFEGIAQNCLLVQQLKDSEVESDRLLYNDLAPWLNTLATRSRIILKMLALSVSKESHADRWLTVKEVVDSVNSLKSNTCYTAYALEGMGNGISVSQRQAQLSEKYMSAFIDYLYQLTIAGYFDNYKLSKNPQAITNSNLLKPYVDYSDSEHISLSIGTCDLDVNKWIGLEFPQPTLLTELTIAEHLLPLLQYSANGTDWRTLGENETIPTDKVKYLILLNDQASGIKDFKVGANEFVVACPKKVIPTSAELPQGNVYEDHGASLLIDANYDTWACLNRVQQVNDAYQIDLGKTETLHDVRVVFGTTNDDYPIKARLQYSQNGTTWTNLKIKGATQNVWSMSIAQNVRISNDAVYCDFNGAKKKARYLRLVVVEANTEKWLRLCEIEVNRMYEENAVSPVCHDADGHVVEELLDGQANTFIKPSMKSPITYHFYNHMKADSMAVYSDQGAQVFPVSPADSCYQIAWEGNVPPSIYEVYPIWSKELSSLPLKGSAIEEAFATLKEMALHALDSCGKGEPLITSKAQLSSPFTETAEGAIEHLLDGNPSTFWHSTWKGGAVADGLHYIQIELPDAAIDGAFLSIGRRSNTFTDQLIKARIQGVQKDGTVVDITDLDLPFTDANETLICAVNWEPVYKYIRLLELKTTGAENASRGYFHLGELQLYSKTPYWKIKHAEAEAALLISASSILPSEANDEDLEKLQAAYDEFMLKVFNQLPTAINNLNETRPNPHDASIYDVLGRKMNAVPPTGLYIYKNKLYVK
jgi:hypothetical protein